MSDMLSKVIALLIAVLLLYIFPVENMLARQDDITRVFVLNETTQFVDSVRNLGYVTPTMYLQFAEVLSATGNSYDIRMEHNHVSIDPLYTDPAELTSFQHDYRTNYKTTYTDEIMEALFPETSQPQTDIYYYLSRGDIFSVHVVNKNKTIASRVQEMLLITELPTKRIIVNYGGMVRDENN
jgi:hypothetical protein